MGLTALIGRPIEARTTSSRFSSGTVHASTSRSGADPDAMGGGVFPRGVGAERKPETIALLEKLAAQ